MKHNWWMNGASGLSYPLLIYFQFFAIFPPVLLYYPPAWPTHGRIHAYIISINIHAKYQYKILPIKYIFKRFKISDFLSIFYTESSH